MNYMDPSSGQQHQEMSAHSLDMLVCSKTQQQQQQQDRKPRPQPEQALKCPRCDSTNTKFCYYNNYSLSQPRYFCKACRRYWTKGGTLRNVPVGGGCRKNKRSSSSSKRSQDQQPLTPNSNNPLPSLGYDSNDLTLAFARLQRQSCGQLSFDDQDHLSILGNPNNTTSHGDHSILGNHGLNMNTTSAAAAPGFLDALRTGFLETHNGNFQNMYYGFGNGSNSSSLGEVENGVCGEMGLHTFEEMTNSTTTAVTVTTMKQELCNARDHQSESNRVLWGFPWQLNGDANNNMVSNECDSGRVESWNGLAPSWHGLLHSPLV
ncbi:unnamed protein product [Prunus brigantina]